MLCPVAGRDNYPSIPGLHNYSAAAVTVKLTVVDAATGAAVGNTTQVVAAN